MATRKPAARARARSRPRARAPAAPAEIRAAARADLPALAAMGARLAREHHAMDAARFFLPEAPLEQGYAWWLGKELANPRAVVLAAELATGEVGERRGSPARTPRAGRGSGRRGGAPPRGTIVGYAYGRIEGRDWNTLRDRCGVAVDLWVDPAARGAGLGRRLVEALCTALAERGAPRVVLNVAARNPSAARLFGRAGFRRTMLEMTREAAAPSGPAPRRPRGVRSRT